MGIFDEIAERKIKDAIENNEFDNLDGIGKPIDNSEYFSVPKDYRLAFHIMKNSNLLPEEMELKKRIININSLIRDELSTNKKDALIIERSELLTRLDVLLDKYRSH